jgi:hypothetical protein
MSATSSFVSSPITPVTLRLRACETPPCAASMAIFAFRMPLWRQSAANATFAERLPPVRRFASSGHKCLRPSCVLAPNAYQMHFPHSS